MQKITLKREPRLEAKHTAFEYQVDALNAIKDLEYSAIFHEQGLGKSKIAIDLSFYLLEKKLVDTVLFVAKKSLVYNWKKEFEAHTFIRPRILTQNSKENYYVFNSPSRIMLTHYEVFTSEFERFKLFLKSRNVCVILDESAKIKTPDSTLTKIMFELAPLFNKRVIMTGTPIANRPYDIWAQIWFLDFGQSLGNNFLQFKNESDLSNDLYKDAGKQERLEQFLNNLFSKISSFSIRETKGSGILELPEKQIITIETDWERHQFDLYRQFQEEMHAVVIKEGIPTEDSASSLLKRLLRLVQIASNPHLVDRGYAVTPGKLATLVDLVSEIRSKNEKCIVWSSFIQNVDWLALELKRFGAVKIHGKMNMEHRNQSIDRFLSDDDTKVLVATPGAAKEGLTLTAANHVIYYDRSFSLDDYLQSQDRIHRISQTKRCYVYKLIMNQSIDEWVEILLQAKHLAAQLGQGDISLEYYKNQINYDFGEIIKGILNIS
ncbi:DEAD/DEAH box helicase [Chloroflexota bacterium]